MNRFRYGCGQQLGKTEGFERGLGNGRRRGRGIRWNQANQCEQVTQDIQDQRGYGRRWGQGRGGYRCYGNGRRAAE